jgi:hypothetical protein
MLSSVFVQIQPHERDAKNGKSLSNNEKSDESNQGFEVVGWY